MRVAAKYSAAAGLTSLYALVGYRILSGRVKPEPLPPVPAVIGVSTVISLTWMATLL